MFLRRSACRTCKQRPHEVKNWKPKQVQIQSHQISCWKRKTGAHFGVQNMRSGTTTATSWFGINFRKLVEVVEFEWIWEILWPGVTTFKRITKSGNHLKTSTIHVTQQTNRDIPWLTALFCGLANRKQPCASMHVSAPASTLVVYVSLAVSNSNIWSSVS